MGTMKFNVVEHFALESPVRVDGTRRVRLISPGQGSSGRYSREVLSSYVAEALPKGTKVYIDHTDSDDEYSRGGTRSYRDVAGKLVTDPVYEVDAPEGEGSYADIKFKSSVEEDLKDIGDVIGVSVEIHEGRKDEYGNVIELGFNRLNSLALVPEPGRDGRVFESFRASAQENPNNEGEQDMVISEEDRKAIVDDVLAGVTEAMKPKPVDEEKVDVAETVKKVVKADLPEALEEAAIAEALDTGDVDAAIAKQTAVVEAVVKANKSKAGDQPDGSGRLSEDAGANPAPKTDAERGQAYMERFKKGGK